MLAPVTASQIFRVASADAEAMYLPLGEMRTCDTGFEWPRRTIRARKSGRSASSGGVGWGGGGEKESLLVRSEEVGEGERRGLRGEPELDLEGDRGRNSRRVRDFGEDAERERRDDGERGDFWLVA